jgi:putative membrane protein
MHQPVDRPMGRWDHMMGPWGYGGMFMWLILIVFAGVVLYFLLERRKSDNSEIASTTETPLEILKKRYARGEITKEEFDRMKDEIES